MAFLGICLFKTRKIKYQKVVRFCPFFRNIGIGIQLTVRSRAAKCPSPTIHGASAESSLDDPSVHQQQDQHQLNDDR